MKLTTALKQLGGWFPVLAVLVPCLWGLTVRLRDWPLAAIASLMSVYLGLDAWKLVKLLKAAEEEPKVIKKRMPGT